MSGFSVYYIEALVACIALFGVLLVHNRHNMDRQEKQIKYDYALIAFIFYFIADCFWAAIVDGLIPKTRLTVVVDTFALYVFISAICYCWLQYVLAVEQNPHRNRPINLFAVSFPFLVTTAVLIVNYIVAPDMLIDSEQNTMPAFSIYLMTTPIIYLGAILFYTIRRAREEENPVEKRRHLFIGLLPLITLLGGVIQMLLPYIPIYCFIDALLMLIFYIHSIEAKVSLDPLTNLNNRGELMRYTSQRSNLFIEDRLTIVIMMDIDRFKMINDTYGHSEGDKALVMVSDALKQAINGHSMPSFLGRYGGDEFILIIHPDKRAEADQLIREIRQEIEKEVKGSETPYVLSVSIGYDELTERGDTVQDCIRRADEKLYKEKRENRQ